LASGKYLSTESLVCNALHTLRVQEDGGAAPPEHAPPPASLPQSPGEYLLALAHVLRTGSLVGRQVVTESAARYPAHAELKSLSQSSQVTLSKAFAPGHP